MTTDSRPDRSIIESKNVTILPESEWRHRAQTHSSRIYDLLTPGMLPPPAPSSSLPSSSVVAKGNVAVTNSSSSWRGLDSRHPTYNFLIDYYGIRGPKGCRRLARWSPGLGPGGNENGDATIAGIFLENANNYDLKNILHRRSATVVVASSRPDDGKGGILYAPTSLNTSRASGYVWFRSILSQTLTNPPNSYCHNLHEWAMVYHPDPSRPPPPSLRFQSHLPLRVSQNVINDTVERRGVACTHYDAIRFFADEALPLLRSAPSPGGRGGCRSRPPPSERRDQLTSEQPACLHAQMDLLKMALKLVPFVSAEILGDALELAIDARKLDVAASPYDGRAYGLDVVAMETREGRRVYRERQMALMERGMVLRKELLREYDEFLGVAFHEEVLRGVTLD